MCSQTVDVTRCAPIYQPASAGSFSQSDNNGTHKNESASKTSTLGRNINVRAQNDFWILPEATNSSTPYLANPTSVQLTKIWSSCEPAMTAMIPPYPSLPSVRIISQIDANENAAAVTCETTRV